MERFRQILGACASLTIAAILLAGPVAAQADDSAGDSQQVAANCELAPGHDGRVLVEVLDSATPQRETFTQLASAYKAINAPVGELGRKTLELSTRALVSDDATYATLEEQLTSITAQRNALAARMIAMLESAAFDHARINETRRTS